MSFVADFSLIPPTIGFVRVTDSFGKIEIDKDKISPRS